MIDIQHMTFRRGARLLFEDASCFIPSSHKVGLIGVNGSGKTTLFSLLLGELEAETGSVVFPCSSVVVHVKQEIKDTSQTLLDFVLSQNLRRQELLEQLNTAQAEQAALIHDRLEQMGESALSAKAQRILSGLGFKQEEMVAPLSCFSGGWQMRAALAGALVQPSDILLLDEPTNHLDLEASLWLMSFLKKYKGTLLFISHDTYLLNEICDDILLLEHKKLKMYAGHYDTFMQVRAEQQKNQARAYEKQEQMRAHLESFVERFRYKATKAKQAQSRLKMLEKMKQVPVLNPEHSLGVFSFKSGQLLPSPILKMQDGVAGYPEKEVLSRLNFQIGQEDRIAFLGRNGNGKTTLARTIIGRLPLKEGSIVKSGRLKIGYFSQNQLEELDKDKTALEQFLSWYPDKTPTQGRTILGSFGLIQERALTKVAFLSGGEKTRLLFCHLAQEEPQLLIMDEPTNHLDIESRHALTDSLNAYDGALILISHDMALLETVCDTLWLVDKGTCREFSGDLEEYRRFILESSKEEKEDKKKEKEEQARLAEKEKQRQQAKQKAQEKMRLKKQIAALEQQLTSLEKQLSVIEEAYLHPLSKEKIVALQKEQAMLLKEKKTVEEKWFDLSSLAEENENYSEKK